MFSFAFNSGSKSSSMTAFACASAALCLISGIVISMPVFLIISVAVIIIRLITKTEYGKQQYMAV